MTQPIIIVPYDPRWPTLFERLCSCLSAALGDAAVAIEHVGSTAVEGLVGKPTIDLDVVVRSQLDVAEAIRRLEGFGYRHRGDLGVTGREAFDSPRDIPQHHLYVVVAGGAPLHDHIHFRDYLRAHPERAAEYGRLKLVLAERFRNERDCYTDAKTVFVSETLELARERPNPSAVAAR